MSPRRRWFAILLAGSLIPSAAAAGEAGSGFTALDLTGGTQVGIRLLEPPRAAASGGPPSSAFRTLSQAEETRATTSLVALFAGAGWVFHPDGSFQFVPSLAADVRDDLFPMTGSYRRRNGTIEFQAQRRSPLGPTASIDGTIRTTEKGGVLDAVYAIAANQVRMASVHQDLAASTSSPPELRRISGLPVPPQRGEGELVARRAPDTDSATAPGDAEDADTLRHRGIELVQAGRCNAARPVLEQSFQTYLRQAQEPSGNAYKPLTLTLMDQVLERLIDCDLDLGEYTEFLADLRRGAGILPSLRSAEEAQPAIDLRKFVQTFEDGLDFSAELLAKIEDHCQQIQEAKAAGSEVREAAGALRTEIHSLLQAMADHRSAVQQLLADTDHRVRPADRTLPMLVEEAARLESSARRSFQRLAAQGKKALAGAPTLVEMRDRYWREALESSPTDIATRNRDETELFAELRRQGGPHGELLVQQAQAGVLLQAVELQMQNARPRLARQTSGEVRWTIGDSAVRAAFSLAEHPERLWARADKDTNKVELLNQLASFFGDLVLVLLQADQKDAALVVAEAARSRALLDLLAGREEVKAALAKLPSQDLHKGLPSPTAAPPPTMAELRKIIQNRASTTLEYFLTEQTLAIWVIAPNGALDAFTVSLADHFPGSSPRKALRDAIDELRSLLESTVADPKAEEERRMRTAELLRRLHGLLIGPIPPHLLPSSPEETLTLIPHAELLGVPFAALRDASGHYFIESHPLVYGPSLAVLRYSREDRERLGPREPRLLALVNPKPMPQDGGERLSQLDELEPVVSSIASLYPQAGQTVLMREEATKAALFAHSGEASELCLVTHAKFLDEADSFIALSAGGRPEDGYLRVPEAYALDLHAELVLLWACETGRGRLGSDGIEGLSRAFIWAGSPSLMLSLWKVPEADSAAQMYGFHLFWRQRRLPLAHALRQAQLEQMALYRDQPGVWAAFVLYGEGQ
jgi:CHAT domain-containing protein